MIRAVSGANAVTDPRGKRVARDGFVKLDHRSGQAPLLTAFGGTVTTSRKRAEIAVSKLTPFYPMSGRWTAGHPLPGGDFLFTSVDEQVERARDRWPFLGENHVRRLVAAYGTRIEAVLGDIRSRDELGPVFGADLSAVELRYLMEKEWARFPDDVLWRRSKLGLAMPAEDRRALVEFMEKATK